MEITIFKIIAGITTKYVESVKHYFDEMTEDEQKIMAMSAIGLVVDSMCATFGLNENETWEMLYNAHAQINKEEGDFKM